MGEPIDLQRPDSWPAPLKAALAAHRTALEAWEFDLPDKSARTFDPAVRAVGEALRPFSLRGWHCTRLTAEEAADIKRGGLEILDIGLLERRIAAQEAGGGLTPEQAHLLRNRNQARESGRRGKAWFCFYPPRLAGQHGTERLFASWGGEALYNIHENDPAVGPALRAIGTPTLVQAIVPIDYLSNPDRVAMTVAHLDVLHRTKNMDVARLEDYSVRTLDSKHIERLIRYPESEFVELSACDDWDPKLIIGKYP